MWTTKFKHWSTTIGRFVTASITPFTSDFVITDLYLPPVTFDDRLPPHKRSRYTPDLLPAEIYIASENSVSTLTTTSDFPYLLPSDYHNTLHVMNKYVPFQGRFNRGYCCRKHGKNMLQKDKVLLINMLL